MAVLLCCIVTHLFTYRSGLVEVHAALRLLQDELFCPYCFVKGDLCLTPDYEPQMRMREFMVRCPHVSETGVNTGHRCRWTGVWEDFWLHGHKYDTAKKRSASDDDNDNSPAVKRPTTAIKLEL